MSDVGWLKQQVEETFANTDYKLDSIFSIHLVYEYGHLQHHNCRYTFITFTCPHGKVHTVEIHNLRDKFRRQKKLCRCRYQTNSNYDPLGRTSAHYRRFKKGVLTRDNYTCQCCGETKRHMLVVHHKDGWELYPQLRFDWKNGVTLCKICHDRGNWRSFHTQFTNEQSVTKENFELWLQHQQKWLTALRIYIDSGKHLPRNEEYRWSAILEAEGLVALSCSR